jgi:hypothetical protein
VEKRRWDEILEPSLASLKAAAGSLPAQAAALAGEKSGMASSLASVRPTSSKRAKKKERNW